MANEHHAEWRTLGDLNACAKSVAVDLQAIDPHALRSIRSEFPTFTRYKGEWGNKYGIGYALLAIAYYEPALVDWYLSHPHMGWQFRAALDYANTHAAKIASKAVAS